MDVPQGAVQELRPILFVRDLAALFDRTESAVRKALAAGRLGIYGSLDGRLFVRRENLLSHLRSCEINPHRVPRVRGRK